jgi:hypothetical protein
MKAIPITCQDCRVPASRTKTQPPRPSRGRWLTTATSDVLITVETPHLIHFDADLTAFVGSEVFDVDIAYGGFFFFNSEITVSVLIPRQREIALTPNPLTVWRWMSDFTPGLQALQVYSA